jgi:hypothetical protein
VLAQVRKVDDIWRSLETQPMDELFSPQMVSDSPAPARRNFLHAIQPGTQTSNESTEETPMATMSVRSIVDDVDAGIEFYTKLIELASVRSFNRWLRAPDPG